MLCLESGILLGRQKPTFAELVLARVTAIMLNYSPMPSNHIFHMVFEGR